LEKGIRLQGDYGQNKGLNRLSFAAVLLVAVQFTAGTGCTGEAKDAGNVPVAAPAEDATAVPDGNAAGGAAKPAPSEALPPPVAGYPPVEWTVPNGGLPDTAKIADIVDVGGSSPVLMFDGCRDRYLTYKRTPDRTSRPPKLIYEFLFGSFDPTTGKPTGDPVSLGEIDFKEAVGYVLPLRADVSPSRNLAIQVSGKMPETIGKIAILEAGAGTLHTLAALPSFNKWFAWAGDDRLLVIREGKLHIWDTTADAAALSFGETLDLPAATSPARNWVVATVNGKYLEVFDAATGEVRGRIGPEGGWLHLAVSPDGRRLAGVRYAGALRQPSTSPA